jgi:pimeloyl-ACP methyl ester carboxylesterase
MSMRLSRLAVAEPAARGTLAHEVAGSGSPLILLHGLSGSGRWWGRNVDTFAAHFRTYSVDLPGFGANRGARWSRLDDTTEWLAAWMAEQDLARVSVAGHSLGGAVAARLAARFPERVDRLVLVDAAIRVQGVRGGGRAGDLVRTVGRYSPGLAPMLVRDLLRMHPWSFVAATVDSLQSDWAPHLARITAPTLVVWGEHDPITPSAHGHRIASAIPGAQLVTVANAGHSPMWERPESFNDAVLQFLRAERTDFAPSANATSSSAHIGSANGNRAP